MTTRSFLLLTNPAAGGGRARSAIPDVAAAFRAAGAQVELVESRSLEHAVEAARAAALEGSVVAALGGDGLIGAVAAAVASVDGVLAPLPGGRGNDFVRGLGLPRNPAGCAAELARAGAVRRIDLAEANGRAFVGIASAGFDSDANRIANDARFVRGQAVYAYAALRALAAWRPAAFVVSVDGRSHEYVGYSVAVANSQWYGGGMRMAPYAEPDDGQLDVVMSSHMSKARFLAAVPKVFSGSHVHEAAVTCTRGSTVHLRADRDFVLYADGEPLCPLPATITVRPGALQVLAPPPAG